MKFNDGFYKNIKKERTIIDLIKSLGIINDTEQRASQKCVFLSVKEI